MTSFNVHFPPHVQYPTARPSALPSDPAHHTPSPLIGRAVMICPLPNKLLWCPLTGPITLWPRDFSLDITSSETPSSSATPPLSCSTPGMSLGGGMMQNRGASSASWGFIPNSNIFRITWNPRERFYIDSVMIIFSI